MDQYLIRRYSTETSYFVLQIREHGTYLDIRTLVLGLQDTVTREARDMEPIPMRVSNQNVARVRNINPVREARNLLVADAVLESAIVTKDSHAVPLKVAHVKVVS